MLLNPIVDWTISIHAPPRGATFGTFPLACPRRFQFTPLREGRPTDEQPPKGGDHISIHAPPRGATRRAAAARRRPHFNSRPSARGDAAHAAQALARQTFQFTPLREGRQHGGADRPTQHHFNSRPSARGDAIRGDSGTSDDISIHAPPRGATAGPHKHGGRAAPFQFTPLREGRRQKICNFCKSFVQPLQISMA